MPGRRGSRGTTCILLVEGLSDVDFFTPLLDRLGLLDRVVIKPPREYGYKDTVTELPKLVDDLIEDLRDGTIERLGIVADADRPQGGGGISARWKTLTEVLERNQYRTRRAPPTEPFQGSIFGPNTKCPPVGLWLMPNHRSDGTLEDLIKSSIKDDEAQIELIRHAETTVRNLPVTPPLFSDSQITKAELYSWLAWQKRPGYTLDIVVRGELLDFEKRPLAGLASWLKRLFGSERR